MDKIFNEKPWVEPLSVAGTSCVGTSFESSSIEETRDQSGNETCYNTYYSLFVINAFVIFNFCKYIFFPQQEKENQIWINI